MLTDKQDYDEIYQKYKNLVMKAAYKYSGNYDIAEDITQSTFLQLSYIIHGFAVKVAESHIVTTF